MEYKEYYEIMGVKRDATQEEIKRAYRKLARKFHPDVSKEVDAEARFKEVGEAYEVLKDPEKRAAYDQLGANWKAGQDFDPPPDWNAGFEFSGGGFTGADSSAYSDFFASLFGQNVSSMRSGRTHTGFHARGEDHHAKVLIDLEDAYKGVTRSVVLRTPEVDSSGHLVSKTRTLNVKIPKGVRQRQRIRLAGQGAPGLGEGETGDLYLEIEFNQDNVRVRHGTPWPIHGAHRDGDLRVRFNFVAGLLSVVDFERYINVHASAEPQTKQELWTAVGR